MKLTLTGKRREAGSVFSFIFKPEQNLSWQAGQYMRYKIEGVDTAENMSRFFTISAAPFEKNIALTTKFVPKGGSVFKQHLLRMESGQSIEATGPNGEFVISDPAREFVFIAGGIGITPFRSMILQMDHDRKPVNVTLLYANRSDEIVFKDELESIAKRNPEFKIHYFIGENRLDEKAIKSSVFSLQYSVFYISGPQAMVRIMEGMVASLGIPGEKIIHDYFPGYSEI